MVAVDAMRLVTTNSGISSPGSAANTSLNATNLAIACVAQAESTETITHVWFRGGTRTGTPPTYSIRIELLDSAGDPDNTDAGGGSPTAATFTPPADTSWNGTGQWIALTNAWTPTLGQRFGIVIRHSSGTCDGSNFFSFTRTINGINANNRNFPFVATYNGSAWTKLTTSWIGAWKGASNVYGYPTTGSVLFQMSGAAGNRVAAAVTLPTTKGVSSQCLGIEVIIDIGNSGSTVIVGIWNAAGTAIETVTLDTDELASNSGRTTRIIFDSQPTLTHGIEYYFGIEVPSGGGGTISMIGFQLGSSADRAAFPSGLNMAAATWNGAAWTKDETVYPLIEITAADLTLPSGGGGGGAVLIGGLGNTGMGQF